MMVVNAYTICKKQIFLYLDSSGERVYHSWQTYFLYLYCGGERVYDFQQMYFFVSLLRWWTHIPLLANVFFSIIIRHYYRQTCFGSYFCVRIRAGRRTGRFPRLKYLIIKKLLRCSHKISHQLWNNIQENCEYLRSSWHSVHEVE